MGPADFKRRRYGMTYNTKNIIERDRLSNNRRKR